MLQEGLKRALRGAQEGPKKAPRRPQEAPRSPKKAPTGPQEVPRGPKRAPAGPKWAQRGPKRATRTAQKASQRGPGGVSKRSGKGPREVRRGPALAQSRPRESKKRPGRVVRSVHLHVCFCLHVCNNTINLRMFRNVSKKMYNKRTHFLKYSSFDNTLNLRTFFFHKILKKTKVHSLPMRMKILFSRRT